MANAIAVLSGELSVGTLKYTSGPSYGEMWLYDNAVVAGIATANEYHAVFQPSTGTTVSGFVFTAGVTAPVASVQENSAGVSYAVNTTGNHNLSAGDIVTHNGFTTAAYKGVKTVLSTPSGTRYVVAGTYSVTNTGVVTRGSRFVASAGSAGVYRVSFAFTVKAVADSTLFRIELNQGLLAADNIGCDVYYAKAAEAHSQNSAGLLTIAVGDHIWLTIKNKTDTSDFTIVHANMALSRAG